MGYGKLTGSFDTMCLVHGDPIFGVFRLSVVYRSPDGASNDVAYSRLVTKEGLALVKDKVIADIKTTLIGHIQNEYVDGLA